MDYFIYLLVSLWLLDETWFTDSMTDWLIHWFIARITRFTDTFMSWLIKLLIALWYLKNHDLLIVWLIGWLSDSLLEEAGYTDILLFIYIE